jgi:ribosomal protein S28E/S33
MGVVVEVVGSVGVSVEVNVQLRVPMAPGRRHRIITRQVTRYFIFIALIVNFSLRP